MSATALRANLVGFCGDLFVRGALVLHRHEIPPASSANHHLLSYVWIRDFVKRSGQLFAPDFFANMANLPLSKPRAFLDLQSIYNKGRAAFMCIPLRFAVRKPPVDSPSQRGDAVTNI